jgi:cell division protein ZapA (FtsZ GTPase activity inhibitor)
MKSKFEFNKYNTDLDKKLRRVRGEDPTQKIVRVAIILGIAVIIIIIASIIISNKIKEEKERIENNISTFDTEQFKQDLGNTITNTSNSVKEQISNGIQDLFSNN